MTRPIAVLTIASLIGSFMLAGLMPAAASTDERVVQPRCHEVEGWVPTAVSAVAGLVPAPFEVAERAPGVANLLVRTYRCENPQIAGTSVPDETGAQVAVSVKSPDGGARSALTVTGPNGAAVELVPECCNWYLLSWSTNRIAMFDWLTQGPIPIPANSTTAIQQTDGLVREFPPLPLPDLTGNGWTDPAYRFETPSDVPYAFAMTASTTQPWTPVPLDAQYAYWVRTPSGAVKIHGTSAARPGYAHSTVEARSPELAEAMGSATGLSASAFGANWFDNGFYAKEQVVCLYGKPAPELAGASC